MLVKSIFLLNTQHGCLKSLLHFFKMYLEHIIWSEFLCIVKVKLLEISFSIHKILSVTTQILR
jgi:hypothetical protein